MPCVSVSSGVVATAQAPWQTKLIPGCLLWLRSDRAVSLSGADVTGWGDQSDAGNDAASGTAPAYGAATGVNGRPGITFAAANSEYLSLSGMVDASNNWTIFAVINQGALTGATQDILCHATGPVAHAATRTTVDFVGGYDGTSWRTTGATTTGAQWLEWHWNSGGPTLTCFRNGVAIGVVSPFDGTIGMAGATAALGAFHDGSIQHYNGVMSEIIAFNRVLNALELAQERAYLGMQYALP